MKTRLLFGFIIVSISAAIGVSCISKTSYPFNEVFEHYSKNPGDSLKLRAAEYLYKHAVYHYGISCHMVDSLDNRVTNFNGNTYTEDEILGRMDSLKYRYVVEKPVMDMAVLTADFIVKNIEMAFEAWDKPWARHITFEEFCEMLLPYRSHTEPISDWRTHLKEKYQWVVDSLKDTTSAFSLMKDIQKAVQEEIKLCSSFTPAYKGWISPEELENFGYGTCVEIAHYCNLVLRAVGVPSFFTTARVSSYSVEHTCNIISNQDSGRIESYYVGVYDERVVKMDTAVYNGPKLSRIRKKTFALQDREPLDLVADGNFPLAYIDLQSVDISWLSKSDSLEYALADSLKKEKYIYLCVFDNWKWIPVKYAENRSGYVIFSNVIINNMYRLGVYRDGETTPITLPFVFFGNNDREYRHATGEIMNQIQLTYRYSDENVVTQQMTTNYMDFDGTWKPISGMAQLYTYEDEVMAPCDDLTVQKEFRYVLTLKDVPRTTIFYDDNLLLKRPQAINRDHLWEPY